MENKLLLKIEIEVFNDPRGINGTELGTAAKVIFNPDGPDKQELPFQCAGGAEPGPQLQEQFITGIKSAIGREIAKVFVKS